MPRSQINPDRRNVLGMMAFGAATWTTPGLYAEMLSQTPRQGPGPFYPDKLPLDTDNDLIILNDKTTPALGEVTWLSGRVLDSTGSPVRNATVEIWQCDINGAYVHTRGAEGKERDTNFQGYGRFLTGLKGNYGFRTIKPVPYRGRTAHIHVMVKHGNRKIMTTEFYVKDHPGNAKDFLFKRVDPKLRQMVALDFKPLEGSKTQELTANVDIVIGKTPEA